MLKKVSKEDFNFTDENIVIYKGNELPQNFIDAGINEIAVSKGTDLASIDLNELLKQIKKQTES